MHLEGRVAKPLVSPLTPVPPKAEGETDQLKQKPRERMIYSIKLAYN